MRYLVPVLAILTVGCAPNDASDFQYETTFSKQTRGVILHEDGESGHAGMFRTNCPFDVSTGMVTGDYDLPDENEDVQDGEPTELGGITFTAITDGVVHVVDKTDGEYQHNPVPAPGAQQARLGWDRVIVLDDACKVKTFDFEGLELGSLDLDSCAGADIEVDPQSGTGIVAGLDHTVRFDNRGVYDLEVTGDLVAWDDYSSQYYVAERGAKHLSAVASDGTVRWTIETPHPVEALDDAGMLESAAVVMAAPEGRGLIAFFEGTAGDLTVSGETPSPAADLAVSNNGRSLALVRPEQSFFFRLMD